MQRFRRLRSHHFPWFTKHWLLMWSPAMLAALLLLAMLDAGHMPAPYVLAALVGAGALAFSRRLPIAAHVAVAVSVVMDAIAGGPSNILVFTAVVALIVAAWSAPSWPSRIAFGAVAIVGFSVAGIITDVMGATYWFNGVPEVTITAGFWNPVMVMIPWGITLGLRAFIDNRRTREKLTVTEQRVETTQSALRDEQLRSDLTRDFHDVMAHSLAVLAAQAEGLRLSYEQHPERIGPVLETISETARLSLIEVRQVLEVSEQSDRFGLSDVPNLIDQVRSAGLKVSVHTIGDARPLGRTAELAAYRVTQEALTNALRHSEPGTDVHAVLSWMGPGLTLTISSALSHTADGFSPGRGIRGMRERTETAGGAFEVSASEGTFVVTAFLPTNPELAAAEALGGGAPSRDFSRTAPAPVPNPLGKPLKDTRR